MASHLYVSFWDLCLDNLPQGRFERRVIGAGEASAMICAARGQDPAMRQQGRSTCAVSDKGAPTPSRAVHGAPRELQLSVAL